jgi:transcriptional regulator with XRE-family HTH domain
LREEIIMRFGEKLQELRQRAGLSQSGLAEKSEESVRNIQNWEIGHRVPRAEALFRLAKALGVSAEVFAECVSRDATRPGRPKGRSDQPGKSK